KTARVWNADGTGSPIPLEGHGDRVEYAAWSPDGKRIVTASWDGTARVWNADGVGAPIVLDRPVGPRLAFDLDFAAEGYPPKERRRRVHSAAWSPDSKRIVIVND